MAVAFARIITCEEDIEAGDFDEIHTGSKNVAGGIGSEFDAIVSVGGVEADGLDPWKGIVEVLLVEELVDVTVGSRSGGACDMCVLHADGVLH